MRRPSVFILMIVVLVLVGTAMAVVAAADGSAALVLAGVGLVLLGAIAYLADRRSRAASRAATEAARRSVDLCVQGFEAVRKDLTDLASGQNLAAVTERLDRLDVRLDKAQRRLVASAEAARLDVVEHEPGVRGAL